MNWIGDLAKMSSLRGHDEGVLLNRPLSMMRACLNRSGGEDDAVESLVDFVNSTDFAWPAEGEAELGMLNYSRPLRVILELAVLWALPLWFRVKLLPVNRSARRNRAVVISPSAIPVVWNELHAQITQYDDAYSSYLELYSSFFKYRRPSTRYKSFLEGSTTVQKDVFGNFSSHANALRIQPRLAELRSLPALVRKLAVEDWVNPLQSIYAAASPITAQDILLATNADLLTALDALTDCYTPEQLYFHTIWAFVQALGGLVSSHLSSALQGYEAGKIFIRFTCFEQVEMTYNVLLASINKAQYTRQEQISILALLENVRTVASEKLRSYSKLNSPLINELADLVEEMKTVVWPEDDFGSPGGFERYYGPPYNGTGDFFGQWHSSRLQLQHTLVHEDRQVDVAQIYELHPSQLFSYNPALNVMSVAVAALAPPYFYSKGTSAMTYGGLGYAYAKAIFEALESMTDLLHGGAVTEPFVASETEAFWNGSWCTVVGYKDWLCPQLPALVVAYETYVRFRNVSSDLPLEGMESYSPEQVFFFTFCHVSCYIGPLMTKVSEQCLTAAKHFEPFSKAFSCRRGSAMNGYA
ncbi:hypothetical protein HPB48_018175 [Haemaphysalis longicornis]|uniref:Peptidase M13 C-terminal domain-containing protein n=1 Tax=Haemaphysalis longicornis TaxID=44386 RepID=A0A9J6GN99_HAELO|nr:hypothetical protein HPB48_018175 [Haemaphysalis longicornis]